MPTPNSAHYDTNVNRSDVSLDFSPAIENLREAHPKSRWMTALLGDFTWTLLGNGIFAACQWGIIIILAKLLTAVAVGQYSLAQAILAPTLMMAAFQLRSVIASDLKHQFTTREYFGFRLTALVAGLTLAIVIAFWTTRSIYQIEIVVLTGLIQCAELSSDTLYGFQQRRGNLVRPAISMILKGPIGLLALSLGILSAHSVLLGLASLLGTRAMLLTFFDLRGSLGDRAAGSKYFDIGRHVQLFRVVFFIGLMTMLIALIGMMPRYFVEFYWGSGELGVYGAISSLISIGLMPVGALGMAAFVPLARAFSNGHSHDFLRILSALLGLSFAIGVGGVTLAYFAGSRILTLLFRPEYAAYTELFQWVMVIGAITFLTASLGASLTAARIFRPQVLLLAIVALTEAGICWALVPKLGLMGAVWGCLGATLVQFAGTAIILIIYFPRPPRVVIASSDATNRQAVTPT
jgi:O-antigen/teichoic acid export membrane protein